MLLISIPQNTSFKINMKTTNKIGSERILENH